MTYINSSNTTLQEIVLNDWNNAFSSKNSPLAKRFSDEYIRAFHLAKEEDRGYTEIISIKESNFSNIAWKRPQDHVDLLELNLNTPLLPSESITLFLSYKVKIPNDRFTKYGFTNEGKFYLKNWFLSPARFEDKKFVSYSNENLDDISNAPTNYNLEIEIPKNNAIASDLFLEANTVVSNPNFDTYTFHGENRTDFTLCITPKKEFTHYKNELGEVVTNLETKIEDINKAIIIDKITHFVAEKTGNSSFKKILVSKEDYNRQPFYGLNQLPSFLSPFSDEFMFELMFLKTYTNNYLKENLQLNPRKNQWIADGIQVFIMMQYIDTYHPEIKMTGNLSKIKLLKSYHFINLDFNQQYNYLYMLMARKNLDQPLTEYKNNLIKFNEQIANKYKAGLSLNYLNSYLGKEIVANTIKEFLALNETNQTNATDFKMLLESKTDKNLDWFFTTLVDSREIIDYKISKIKKQKDSVYVTIKNKTKTNVPISLYQLKNDSIINKQWLENIKTDTTFVLPRNEATKLVLNYQNEVPEYSLRNNWKSLKGFFFNHRPLKLNFYKDLEEPNYNQLFYMPEFEFNLYDGIAFGVRFNNKSILNKPFNFSVAPFYSTNTGKIIGNFSAIVDDYVRDDSKLYRIIYGLSGNQSHYAPNTKYTRIIPSVQFIFRDRNLRTNKTEYIQIKEIFIDREGTKNLAINTEASRFSVFSASYGNFQSEITKVFNLSNQVQISNSFGNVTTVINYRKLFENNRQISLRLFAGKFIYSNKENNLYSFGLDKPVDLTFQTNLLGRSESTGLFSQQFVYSEGGFKSKLDTRYANNWMTTINGSVNIWNWIQVYGDVGLLKNHFQPTQFLYDSGIHLNLVPDYFELFLPVQSSNGFELNDKNYHEKIRFLITISPKTLVSLFTRKWF
ncbi:aminopeptidase [Flavobacterium sp. J27]|uniref:aminopeptidase n=1 Tax=Flavobacterium sp. J27 TaxID=2060419 RepID=UPI001F0EC2A7|nr:aminopeptidase [Flavobacterium sp. J27]